MKTDAEIKAAGVYDITPVAPGMLAGYIKLPECKRSSVVWGRDENGMEHVSVAPLNRFHTPSWDEMCLVKDTFFYAEEECYEIHPKHSQYVDKVSNCLHIWRPKNGLTIDALTSVNLEAETNKPLTIEELRKMDGEPVWCVSLLDNHAEWGILRVVEMSQSWFVAISGASRAFGDTDSYAISWWAYRHKPEEKGDTSNETNHD